MRILVISAVAIVVLWVIASRTAGDPSSSAVIGEIHQLQDAQVDFYSRHGRYAESIAELAPELELGKSGYRFRVTAQGNSYTIEAKPLNGHGTAFFSDETMVVKSSRTN